ncbi:uncharacterized protein LOC130673189 isoform X1 [Microplitis mediator]|uniref:uncharacterized protein LOC130673189 isoform X1 n=1 Tax=Microplitis mediator TaxID=375433 RepID=UPI00255494CA|nr:uncharacterized protein LOC130673189 isoform X1 [Microplitis mediator]
MADQSDRSQLPPGWECRYDIRSGRPYFINHFNCSTSWEDPRVRYWQYAQYTHGQNSTATSSSNGNSHEAIPLQSGGNIGGGFVYTATHRAPQVYPSPSPYNNPQPAFLPCLQDLKTPMSTTRSISATTNKFGDMTIGSPTPLKNMETSFTQSSDVELQVAKINAIFPTVSDTHIRLLLKKYNNRPALVVSALQIEKNPLCAPGPGTPVGVHSNYAIPRWRLPAHAIHAAITLSPPRGARPAPHSPKMKLRYLKNVFPKVDETLLLDILEQSDNNVQKASEKLIEQGYEKRNPTGPSKSLIRPKEDIHKVNKVTPTPPPRMKSVEEKNKLKTKLMEKYKSVPDRVIALAMDSVDYDEEKAVHILDIMIAEEAVQPLRTSSSHSSRSDERKDSPPITEAIKLTASPIKKILNKDDADKSKRSKNKIETHKISRGTSTTEDSEYKSPYITKPIGANSDLAKGPDNDLLLPDYAPWAGPDSSLLLTKETIGIKSLAVGRDLSFISGSRSIAKGPNADLRKGPLRGLAQGSIYSQRNAANTESRGK